MVLELHVRVLPYRLANLGCLVGGAPINHDSGPDARPQSRRWREDLGAQRGVHGALTAIRRRSPFKAFYDRLTAWGRPKKVALVAVMRNLLTILNASSGTASHGSLRLTAETSALSCGRPHGELGP